MTNIYASYPITGGGGIPGYANFAAFPSPVLAGNGALAIDLSTDILYISNGTIWEKLADPNFSPGAITGLTGDVSATGPGNVPATVNLVGGSTAANVNATVIKVAAAASINTASTLVLRDGSGNFAAGTITAALTGHASADLQIANNLSDVASLSAAFKNISPLSTAGDIIYENATPTPARLPIGSTGNLLTVSGGLPTWAPPATSGTVTSVGVSGGSTGLTTSGGPVTSSGTITLAGTLAVGSGGTNSTTALVNGRVMESASGKIVESGYMYTDDINSRLGINTTTPSGKAHVTSNGDNGFVAQINSGGTTQGLLVANLAGTSIIEAGINNAQSRFTIVGSGSNSGYANFTVNRGNSGVSAGYVTGTAGSSYPFEWFLGPIENQTNFSVYSLGVSSFVAQFGFLSTDDRFIVRASVGQTSCIQSWRDPSNNLQGCFDAAGRFAVGPASANIGAIADFQSTVGAVLFPRMTTTQRNAITAVNGMHIYNTTTTQHEFYQNGAWVGFQGTGNYITALTGDVVATGPGSVSATIQAGAVTNAKIAAAAGISVNKLAALTASSAVASDASGFLISSATTSIQLGYLSTTTSDVQIQLNGKQATGNYITALTGDVVATGPGSVSATIQASAVTNSKIANSTIDLTAKVTGALPIANGGTGQTTANPAFNALSPLTTKGDLVAYSTVNARLPVGTNGQILTADSTQTLGVKWAAASAAGVASPTVTGTVTSYFPTIQSAVNNVSSASYTILTTDGYQEILVSTGASNRTVTMPAVASNIGRCITVKKTDSGAGIVTLTASAAETFEGFTSWILAQQYQSVTVVSDGTNWNVVAYKGMYTNQYVNVSGGTAVADSAQNSVVVPYTATYLVCASFTLYTGTSIGNVESGGVKIKTGSATYASATLQVSSRAQITATVATDRGIGVISTQWVGSVTGGQTIHGGVIVTDLVAAGGYENYNMSIVEVSRP